MVTRSGKRSAQGANEITAAGIEALRGTFRGELLLPGDEGYDPARQVYNAMIDRRPALIARCLGVADVVAALEFGRSAGLEISVRGGGHSVSGHAVVDGGLMIDLSLMRAVHVDPERMVASVQGGALLMDLDREAAHFGLATPAGLVADTGVGGLTLGGGYGWLARRYGLACDNLRAAEVVTADGSLLTASAEQNPDLFWALRGGGGNFGIVTTFDIQLHRFGPMVGTGDLYFRVEDGTPALRAFRDLLAEAPDEFYLMAYVIHATADVPVAEEHRGRPVVGVSWVWVGDDLEEGERVAAPLHVGTPIAEVLESVTYVALQSIALAPDRTGKRHYWKSSLLADISDAALAAFLEGGAEANRSAPIMFAEMLSMGGAIARVGEDATAFGNRHAVVDFICGATWTDAAEDEQHMSGARDVWQAVSAHGSSGVYVNNLGSEGEGRIRAAYGAAKYQRLAEIKARYDPENVFHLNQNIRPAEVHP
ncbi:MAG: FAD-binding oxidoreductase [Chloroflexi bacterium]|nr:FAD-binding oxidoreductase [Chloroflexota bacterium]